MSFHWLSLVAIIWLQTINGTNSNFPAYSSQLKTIFSISQLQLNNLAFASDAGKLLGWISGLAAAHLPLWLILLIGAALGAVGYGLQFLLIITDKNLPPISYWHVFLLTVVAGNSICWINTVSYIVAIRNFPFDRQIAVGISTSYVGLSAKIYTDIVRCVSPDSDKTTSDYLLFSALLPLLVCIVAAPFTGDFGIGKSKRLTGGFVTLFAITIVTSSFAVISSLIDWVSAPVVVLVGIVVLLLLPVMIPVVERVVENMQQKCWIVACEKGLNFGGMMGKGDEEGEVEIGASLMLIKLEFWLYYLVYLFGATVGLVYLNNLGQIAESRGYGWGISTLVSLASAFGFFGRLFPCLLDYFFSKTKYAISRATTMGVMTSPMCVAFIILVMSKHEFALYGSTAILGICTGAITSISVSATTELFGTKNFGLNHNILISNIPIGSFLFGDFAAFLYDKEKVDGEEVCMGDKCYKTTFLIWASLCLLATLLAFLLHVRTQKAHAHN
ncbi:hypothetical protein ACS0TY_014903 [Phlomoides rotata]